MPRKVRELIQDLERAGYYLVKGQGKGDHRKYRHPTVQGSLILDGKAGADAKPYQEKQARIHLCLITPMASPPNK